MSSPASESSWLLRADSKRGERGPPPRSIHLPSIGQGPGRLVQVCPALRGSIPKPQPVPPARVFRGRRVEYSQGRAAERRLSVKPAGIVIYKEAKGALRAYLYPGTEGPRRSEPNLKSQAWAREFFSFWQS